MALLVKPDGFVGNQFLPGLGGGRGNLGYVPIDLRTIPGEQFVSISTDLSGAGPMPPPASLGLKVYPNPCGEAATIRFALPRDRDARLEILDLSGRRVRDLGRSRPGAGTHYAQWDGRDGDGSAVEAGLYFVRLTTPGGARTARLMLVR